MCDDREVLRTLWEGRVPAVFNLAAQEVETLTAPDPFYLLLPRMSYLPLVTEKVRKHLARFVRQDLQDSTIWFEFDGAPVKWHLPIGALFDQARIQDPDLSPPWSLTVHFDKFPKEEIIELDTREDVETYFMSCVKEADQLKHQGKFVSNMQKKDHNQLWQGLHNDKFDQFWAVNRRLMEVPEKEEGFRYVPVRVIEQDKPMKQGLYKPVVGDKQQKTAKTFRDLLKEVLPDRNPDEVVVLSHGVTPPLEMPLQWMSEHLSYPDNFLYICVK